jgi:hypothetical protein
VAQYYRVSPSFWRGRRGWSDREKLFAFYLLSCPHRNLEGLYWLPLAYAQADLGWQSRTVDDALRAIERDKFAAYDRDAQVVFVCKALSYQAPSTDKQVIGAVGSLERVPDTGLWPLFLDACQQWAPKLFAAAKGMRSECDPNAIREGSSITSISDTHRAKKPSGSDPDIAHTRCSNSNSISTTPPDPPRGKRARDQENYRTELDAWVVEHPHTETLAEEWNAVKVDIRAEHGDPVMMAIDYLHPHCLGEMPVFGSNAGGDAGRHLDYRHLPILRDVLGVAPILIDCQCELTREQAA